MPPQFSPVRSTRASSDVVAQVRAAIFSGRYRPGDRLPTERAMAHQFGVSRVTVRDALRTLEASGLVRVKGGGQGGPYVSERDISLLSDSLGTHLTLQGATFRELAEARLALETTAARLAAERATEDDLSDLRAAIERPLQATHDTVASSLDFHRALVQAAHNGALLTMFMATRALIQQAFDTLHAFQPDMIEAAREAHRHLYDAVAARNADAAVRLMREHLYDFAVRAERVQEQVGLAGSGSSRKPRSLASRRHLDDGGVEGPRPRICSAERIVAAAAFSRSASGNRLLI